MEMLLGMIIRIFGFDNNVMLVQTLTHTHTNTFSRHFK